MEHKNLQQIDEATAYRYAAECLKPVEKLVEPHKLQQAADKIVGALLNGRTWAKLPAQKEMTLDEFVKNGITQLMAEAARLAAGESASPDEAAGIVMAFFTIEMKLRQAWDKAVREAAGEGDEEDCG